MLEREIGVSLSKGMLRIGKVIAEDLNHHPGSREASRRCQAEFKTELIRMELIRLLWKGMKRDSPLAKSSEGIIFLPSQSSPTVWVKSPQQGWGTRQHSSPFPCWGLRYIAENRQGTDFHAPAPKKDAFKALSMASGAQHGVGE